MTINLITGLQEVEDLLKVKLELSAIQADNVVLERQMQAVPTGYDDLSINTRRAFLEIVGIPQLQGEIGEIIMKLAEVYEENLNESDIITAAHVTTKSESFKPIIVKFRSVEARDSLYFKEEKKNVKLADLKLIVDAPQQEVINIYFNDHLSQVKGKLLAKLRKIKREKKWAGAWSSKGKRFVKINLDDVLIRIISDWDMDILS